MKWVRLTDAPTFRPTKRILSADRTLGFIIYILFISAKHYMKLHLWPKWLLFLSNAILWGAPGIDIVGKGFRAFAESTSSKWLVGSLAFLVLVSFLAMFLSIVGKNIRRVNAMEGNRLPFWQMMPIRTWCVLFFMMGLGITLSVTGWADGFFTAFFYPGLGIALCVAAIRYCMEAFGK